MKLETIAASIGGKLHGDGNADITGIAAIAEAQEGEITFLLSSAFEKYLPQCRASAIIVGPKVDKETLTGWNFIVAANPAVAMITAAGLFEKPASADRGVSPKAHVASSAVVSPDAAIFAFVYVDEGAVVEKDCVIYPFCYIGRNVKIGEGSTIFPNVTVYDGTIVGRRVRVHSGAVLGADGFGYVQDGERRLKIPQLGVLEIEDDVEIGANTCVDRASLQKTIVGRGVKIDNLVQIAHNVVIGENSVVAAQTGVAGSSSLGKNVTLAGKVGVGDHIAIGDNVIATGGAGITKNVKAGSIVGGNPHMAHRDWLKLQAQLRRLPELFERMRKIEERLFPEADHDRDR